MMPCGIAAVSPSRTSRATMADLHPMCLRRRCTSSAGRRDSQRQWIGRLSLLDPPITARVSFALSPVPGGVPQRSHHRRWRTLIFCGGSGQRRKAWLLGGSHRRSREPDCKIVFFRQLVLTGLLVIVNIYTCTLFFVERYRMDTVTTLSP